MNPYPTLMRWGLGLLFVVLMLAGLAKCSYDKGVDSANAKQAKADAKATVIARKTEDALHGVIYDVAYAAEESRIERERKTAAALAGLRTGTVVVRPRFQCPRLPSAAEAASAGDGEAGGGLLPADVEFLLHEASRADAIADQLRQCQAVAMAFWQATQP